MPAGIRAPLVGVALAGLLLLSVGGCASAARRWEPAALGERTPASETFRYADTAGSETVDIHYERVGSGTRAVIFLHGFGSSIRNWDDLRQHLDPGDSQLLFLDLKGFGLSERPRDDRYSLRHQAEIVGAFVEARGVESVVLVGHSYGGAVALTTAVLLADAGRGDLVRQLILIDSAAYGRYLPLFIDLLRTPVLGRLATWLLPRRLQLSVMVKKAYFDNRTLTPEVVERYVRFYRLPGTRYSFRKAARQAVLPANAELERRYPEVEVPTYLIWGRRDRMLPADKTGERLARELRAREFEIIEECGHIPQEEMPAVTAEILSRFLAEVARLHGALELTTNGAGP